MNELTNRVYLFSPRRPFVCFPLICYKKNSGIDVIQVAERQVFSSAAIVGIAIGGVLLLLFVVDLLCCITVHMGVMATMCRKAKRSPSEIDDEAKLGR